ncbi:MAG: FHA domain-containing protein [Bdellovibrionales bacterium]|nr:FHA domain-containing protein [Bdellovibrionales bacterium]
MFALEITFKDGVSEAEAVFVRRPQTLIGASDYAHVVVEDMRALGYQISVSREIGRTFRCRTISIEGHESVANGIDGEYENQVQFDCGNIKLRIAALDFDLLMKQGEAPDTAGVRILRQACESRSPIYPAIVVPGPNSIAISFAAGQPVYVGRSKECALRFDSAEISGKHARMGYENGEFWIEDLGSTNGTFINQQQISGRVSVAAGVPITLGREISIVGVTAQEQVDLAAQAQSNEDVVAVEAPRRYPVLVSVSEVARPARLVVPEDASLSVGRDPLSDMWLGAPHISRRHFTVDLGENSEVVVTDWSTNGTAYEGGVLNKGDRLEVHPHLPRVLDMGSGVTVAICFNTEQEEWFLAAQGSPRAFQDLASKNSPEIRPSLEGSYQTEGSLAIASGTVGGAKRGGFLSWISSEFRSRSWYGKLGLLMLLSVSVFVLSVVLILVGQVLS